MGCWCPPFKTEQAEAIRQLMMEPLSVKKAKDSLYHLVGDDELFNRLDNLNVNNKDCRFTVLIFLQGWFGITGDDESLREGCGWTKEFDYGALVIFKEMLTEWEEHDRYPSSRTENGKAIMTASELATYVAGYIEDLANDHPMEAAKIFEHVFDTATVVVEDGTFTVDMDGKID